MIERDIIKVAIIGLGYVGLPLLCHFAAKFQCFGLDINKQRIKQLSGGLDSKHCVNENQLSSIKRVSLTSEWNDLKDCNVFIVTAPTPINETKQPDLSCLKDICQNLGKVIKKGNIIVFESTVAPGTTEEICIPIIENESTLKLNDDFAVGFSPERINIGDTVHTLSSVPKIVSASNPTALSLISDLYQKGLDCPVVSASSIKTAEAAKLYENVQRDVLIALANQYSDYCKAEGINIHEVTRCASTKWNFAEVYPGLVGGHCIGVDPYYLISRAEDLKIDVSLVKLARNLNEYKVVELANRLKHFGPVPHSSKRILLLGFSYKADTCDIRNTKVAELYELLAGDCRAVSCYDPLVNITDVYLKYGITLIDDLSSHNLSNYDLVVITVPHKCFSEYIPQDIVTYHLNQFI